MAETTHPAQAGPPRQQHPLAAQTVARYRTPDRLQVGDQVPPLELSKLEGGTVQLDQIERERPLVLVFGSCT